MTILFYLHKVANRTPYIKNFDFSQTYNLFSTAIKYQVKNIKQVSNDIAELTAGNITPFITTIINIKKHGGNDIITAIAPIPSSEWGIYDFHESFIDKLIQQQTQNPEASITAIVNDPFNTMHYEVVKFIGSNVDIDY